MNPIFEAALEIEAICRAANFKFCFIGGLAVQRWGQPRMTADVDLTVVTGFGGEDRYVDRLLAKLSGRIPDAREFALRHRTLLVAASNGIHADIALGAMPFEERAAERASPFAISESASVTTCSAEDLIVHKAFAGRDKDWLDIEGIVIRQGDHLDPQLIWAELLPLLELREDTGTTETRLRRLLELAKA
ncbi:MAG TPA: nucleotidyl transferase AbiEii/AbiGii toxin family protein [Kofleriaceae bacterium]|nr:nucleotidyl transferase AbiEii/AbiGii toxin family protein [Kofleriaceae bacterium]